LQDLRVSGNEDYQSNSNQIFHECSAKKAEGAAYDD
jgi:hypothetical protein